MTDHIEKAALAFGAKMLAPAEVEKIMERHQAVEETKKIINIPQPIKGYWPKLPKRRETKNNAQQIAIAPAYILAEMGGQ